MVRRAEVARHVSEPELVARGTLLADQQVGGRDQVWRAAPHDRPALLFGVREQGVGSVLNDLSREVGGAIGIAVIGSVLAAACSSHVNVNGLSSQLASRVKDSYALATRMSAPLPDRPNAAFVSAMHIALSAAAGAALAAAIGVVLLLARRPAHGAPDRERAKPGQPRTRSMV